MKKIGKVALLSFMVLSIGGCFVSEKEHEKNTAELRELKNSLKELRENLGDFQYLANDPNILITIKDVTFHAPDSAYGNPSVKFKANLKQTNQDFPLTNYAISVTFSIIDENKHEVEEVIVVSEIINGVLALAEEKEMYGVKRFNFDGHQVIAKEYCWHPIFKFVPNKS